MQMICRKPVNFLLAAMAFVYCQSLLAVDQEPTYAERAMDDASSILSAPLRWQEHEWSTFAWSSFAVLGTAALLDNPLREETRKHPYDSEWLIQVEKLGAEYSLITLGGFYLAGNFAEDATARSVAQDGLTASIIASGIITPSIKVMSGRTRPYENEGNSTFNGLAANKLNTSFPSGHTTEAFALASVISAHYEESWIQFTSYALASTVGLARIEHDAHFASDVVAGAMIGYWVGSTVVARHKQSRSASIILLPAITGSYSGIKLVGNFQ